MSADEAAADLLEYDGGGRGGVVDEGDAIDVVGIDEVCDGGARFQDATAEHVEEEFVGLLEKAELACGLRDENRARTASEASIIDPSDAALVVGEFFSDLGVGNGVSKLGFLGGVVVVLYGTVSRVWDAVMGLGKCGHCLGNRRVSGWR